MAFLRWAPMDDTALFSEVLTQVQIAGVMMGNFSEFGIEKTYNNTRS